MEVGSTPEIRNEAVRIREEDGAEGDEAEKDGNEKRAAAASPSPEDSLVHSLDARRHNQAAWLSPFLSSFYLILTSAHSDTIAGPLYAMISPARCLFSSWPRDQSFNTETQAVSRTTHSTYTSITFTPSH